MDLLAIWHILQVVLGVGLVIFVHELGHFMTARWCGVRVDVFSLGFGPRLFGWRRGETLYQVAAVPLGGYVRMAGDEDFGRRDSDGVDPGSLSSKSVGQRFLIYSGGVIMNVVFGLVVFPILFAIGVPLDSPIVRPMTGGPAWQAGIEPGTRVLAVNGEEVHDFYGIQSAVAIAPRDEIVLTVLAPGEETPRDVHLSAVRDPNQGIYSIGVAGGIDPDHELVVAADSPAFEAGLRGGDQLLTVEGGGSTAPIEKQLNDATSQGEPLQLRVNREGEQLDFTIAPKPREGAKLIGVEPVWRVIGAIRSSALTDAIDLRVDDVLLAVDAKRVLRTRDLEQTLLSGEGVVRLEVERNGRNLVVETPPLSAAERERFVRDVALRQGFDSALVNVFPGSGAARGGLEDGDEIRQIDGTAVKAWEDITELTRAAVKADRRLAVTVLREAEDGGAPAMLELVIEPAPRQEYEYGLGLTAATYVYKTKSLGEALSFGWSACWRFLQDTWLTLKSMLFGRVSADNLGGPIMIAVVSHTMAELGPVKFFFFLCILSINLALINVLPIPLLDGGHLLFLLIEKIKGSPVSERVMSYSQLVGLVLIATLFVYVIFNDLQRFLG